MFSIHRRDMEWCGRRLTLETGRVARQADGAVLVGYGDTQLLCTAVCARRPAEGVDFFPLTVQYQEKAYAAGKIPGGFFRREGRPSEGEILVSRLIDRPIRPLFPSDFRVETQVICTVLSYDRDADVEVAALIGASAALSISGMPFAGPVGAVRVGYDGAFHLNPDKEQMASSRLNLMVAGTREGVLMVESEADGLDEDIMLEAVMTGLEGFRPVIDAISDLAKECGKEPVWLSEPSDVSALEAQVKQHAEEKVREAYAIRSKRDRSEALSSLRKAMLEHVSEEERKSARKCLEALEKDIVRESVLSTGKRIDGRGLSDIRPIECQVGVVPRAHGSALFTRGETQALVVTTLGTSQDEQRVDTLDGEFKERFLLHYNFPPFSVGETGRMFGPGRREMGHGKLAWRALHSLIPSHDTFPYTLRVVSDITESNGSSSMATVCGASLALMDAGVPIRKPCAGIAMGLIQSEDGRVAVLSDILGDEDHFGDMDFKVAGTKEGVTSLQMDLKVASISRDVIKAALEQAREGRLHILHEMSSAIIASRDEVSEHAPRITSLQVPRTKIRDIIGTGGKVIREICEVTGAKVDIDDDGQVRVSSADQKAMEHAVSWIEGLVAEPEVGKVYKGKVVKVVDFGAFVNFLRGKDGLVHISELSSRRVAKVTDVCKEGDEVLVKCVGLDAQGRVRLSMKNVREDEA